MSGQEPVEKWIEYLAEPRTPREFAERFNTTAVTARRLFQMLEDARTITAGPMYVTKRGERRDSKRGPLSETFQIVPQPTGAPTP